MILLNVRLKTCRLAWLALIGLLLAPLPVAAEETVGPPVGEPTHVYQRINVLVAHHDNRVSLRVWEDGWVEMRFPPYTPQAGLYRWEASTQELAELDTFFAAASRHESSLLETARAARSDGELILVADADLVRFERRGADRASHSLMLEAPDAWSRALPESTELSALARTEAELLEWMRSRATVAPR